MAWEGTHTFVTSELFTASMGNTYINNNLNYLHTAINSQIQLFGASITPSTTSGCGAPTKTEMSTNKNNYVMPSFVNGSQTYGEWVIELPADYGGGTITFHANWTANSTSTNSVIWGLAAVAITDNGALDVAFGSAQEVTDANGSSAYTLRQTTESAAITIAGTPTAGKMVGFRVYRKGSGSDNLAVAALLESITITYTRL